MTIRCKALCTSVKKMSAKGWYTDPPGLEFLYAATFCAVSHGTSPENKAFFASTPTLTIELSAINGDKFEPGKEYYVDFIKAEPVPVPAS